MKLDELTQTATYKQFWAAMRDTDNMEFWALKTQIYIEYRLKHLLAVRLGVQNDVEDDFIKQFETIQYRHLALLALAGTGSERLLSQLEKLNNVRREVAHRFQASTYLSQLETFARAVRSQDPWPSDVAGQISSVIVALAVVTTLVELKIRKFEHPETESAEYGAE